MKKLLFIAVLLLVGGSIHAAQDLPDTTYLYTYQQLDGNRIVAGSGTFPEVRQLEIAFDAAPQWVLGYTHGGNPVWVVTLDDGRVQTATLDDESVTVEDLGQVAPNQPPLIAVDSDGVPAIVTVADDLAAQTHPVPFGEGLLYVAANGDVVYWNGEEVNRLALDALRAARIVVNDAGVAAVYIEEDTERYCHSIMGDFCEPRGVALLEFANGEVTIANTIILDAPNVFEGISPFWADITDDGQQELITTVSNGSEGARVRAYHADGSVAVEGDPIGTGFRWRHQLAYGEFGFNRTVLVEVITPHIGGLVFYSIVQGDEFFPALQRVASGYSSHIINSTNLDMAVGGDFDGDGQLEIVMTTQERDTVAALRQTTAGIGLAWSFPLNGIITSNFSAVELEGGMALAVGTDANRLMVWLP